MKTATVVIDKNIFNIYYNYWHNARKSYRDRMGIINVITEKHIKRKKY